MKSFSASLKAKPSTRTIDPADLRHMRHALALASRNLGDTWPNPSVGCVIVKNGRVVGHGWTGRGGSPHAETDALAQASDRARDACAYVTLEPCAHHGETPPCADALVDAGIIRCVTALSDPDRRVNGKGLDRLTKAGIEIVEGVLAEEAAELNLGFLRREQLGRPMVTLKLAASLDGRIATHSGDSQWITGPEARARAHLMRARHDAILVGSETAIIDNPGLTCRLPGIGHSSPVRIIADGRLRLPLTHQTVATAREVPTWILTGEDGDTVRQMAFTEAGCRLIKLPADDEGTMDLRVGMERLADQGITRVFVEGGARVAAAFLRDDLVDRIVWFTGSSIIGGDGREGLGPLGIDRIDNAPALSRLSLETLGKDTLATYAVNYPG